MSHPRRAKKHIEEEHENHERWLVSYADMVTLLMCLFIVLFAISQVDTKKFQALSNGLQEGFGAPMTIMDHGVSSKDPSVNVSIPAPVNIPRDASISGKDGGTSTHKAVEDAVNRERQAKVRRDAESAYAEFSQIRKSINDALTKAGFRNTAAYKVTTRGLVISITTDHVLFDSASAELKPAGLKILNAVAPPLRKTPKDLAIEGHTNQLRLLPGTRWPSDWELSAYRATSVLRHLANVGRLPKKRMYAAAFSDTRPLVNPSSPSAVTRNRRVDIVVLSDASSESNALLPGLDTANRKH